MRHSFGTAVVATGVPALVRRCSRIPIRGCAHPSAVEIATGDLQARFVPAFGMLGVSLRHRSAELLRRIEDLDTAAAKGSTAGIPPLHPWANRLPGPSYRAAGRAVELDTVSPLLHLDGNGLPMHGVPWARLAWQVTAATASCIAAQLDWSGNCSRCSPSLTGSSWQ